MTHTLAQLIEHHRTAWRAFKEAVVAYDTDVRGDEIDPAYFVACDAEQDALLALCSYHCESIEEAGTKAIYLLTAPGVNGDLQSDHVTQLLQSFVVSAA